MAVIIKNVKYFKIYEYISKSIEFSLLAGDFKYSTQKQELLWHILSDERSKFNESVCT